MPSTICAASAIFSGSPPKIWIENRPLLFGVLSVFERAIDAADEPFRAHHLRDDKTATAMSFHHPAEGCVGHPRHRATTNGEERSMPAARLIPCERVLRRVVNDEHLPERPTAFARCRDVRHHPAQRHPRVCAETGTAPRRLHRWHTLRESHPEIAPAPRSAGCAARRAGDHQIRTGHLSSPEPFYDKRAGPRAGPFMLLGERARYDWRWSSVR